MCTIETPCGGGVVEDLDATNQILELIALVGFYPTVSFFANGLRLPPEPYGVPPPVAER